ncbi:MAG: glutamate-5-semialdehyde dehydrogenase [Deltaproteobacteria bacterium]|nr:glutamate-5-semialdehyde dehydrogenase [Deltaproteobacteria bacterium]MBW2071642.1 glutamate-5-semialdehyde dehydrogenase [Deltaproteobacteria bacterium]
MDTRQAALQAKGAAIQLAAVGGELKKRALAAIATTLEKRTNDIVSANRQDLERSRKENLAAPLLKRLKFDEAKIKEACQGLQSLQALANPVGVTLSAMELDEGLELYKVSCPIGVIGVIFESRPDALVQISSLCLMSGNAVLLKGGSEAAETNRILAEIIYQTSVKAGIPAGWLALLETRADVAEMLRLDEYIDLIVPRGSNAFVQHIMANTNIPVLGHAEGICHVYVDRTADLQMAERIVLDSKCQYVAVCNAAETLLVHRDAAKALLPQLQKSLEQKGVEIRGCEETGKIIEVVRATEEDWRTEYLDLILAVKIVDSLQEAIEHINKYGSGHTDVIVTGDRSRGLEFMNLVDSADVFLNCSSRFSDGYRYGLGAEVGISTNKIHARGPVGMEGLLIYKWLLFGNGHIVADYTGEKAKSFIHRKLQKKFNQVV